AGVPAFEKSVVPHPREQRLRRRAGTPCGREHDKRREILALATQAVTEPGTQARLPGHLAAGHHERASRVVVDGVGVNGLDQREVVDAFRRVWDEFTRPATALAVLRKLE